MGAGEVKIAAPYQQFHRYANESRYGGKQVQAFGPS